MLRRKWLLFSIVVCAGVAIAAYSVHSWYRSVYPFGRSHCCDKQLANVLFNYADTHDGSFPSGGETPEASLSQIHFIDEYGCASLLCGKTGSESLAQQILDQGPLLGPDTCGWNYVEGLRTDDDPRLALFWDKEGLGHNGERLAGGGHIVMFVSGFSEYIPAAKWKDFLMTQRAFCTNRKRCRAATMGRRQ